MKHTTCVCRIQGQYPIRAVWGHKQIIRLNQRMGFGMVPLAHSTLLQ